MEYVASLFSLALIASAIRVTMPILLASLGAVYTERGGVVTTGLEGIMIMGPFFGAVGAYLFDAQFPELAGAWPDLAPLAGVLTAMAAGLLFGLIHALVTITFRVDQIISGVALNLLAGGLARFLNILLFERATQSPGVRGFTPIDIPLLRDVPTLRPLVTGVSPMIVVGLLLVIASQWVLTRTRFCLRRTSSLASCPRSSPSWFWPDSSGGRGCRPPTGCRIPKKKNKPMQDPGSQGCHADISSH